MCISTQSCHTIPEIQSDDETNCALLLVMVFQIRRFIIALKIELMAYIHITYILYIAPTTVNTTRQVTVSDRLLIINYVMLYLLFMSIYIHLYI